MYVHTSSSVLSALVLGTLCVLSTVHEGDASVISIDFSSEWIKIALVKPGVPMEIVLNKESKRKTAAIVALRNEERMFSDAAMSTAVKYPKLAYQYLQFIAGLHYDNPLVKKYKEWFPYYDIRKDEDRNTLIFQHSDDLSFTTEELIAMLLNNSRQLAQDYAGVPIRNAIITVPPFYTQAQRRSIRLAAHLVGLNVLQLITDTAAVALNYGVFRRNSFNTSANYLMYFDMGSTSTTASVVEYKKVQVKEKGTAHIEPQLTVKGVGFDRTLGGLEMDMRLRDHLTKAFIAKHKTEKSIYDSPRAMAKLLKEARRVKMVLSANVDHVAQIEGLHEDIDFSLKVSRAEFEEMCKDLFERIAAPIIQALKTSEITLDEIDSIMLVGGGTRVPKVRESLLKVVKRNELGQNLNTDEAAALGAVYQAASLSKLFRVKKFIVKDANIYPIQVSFDKPIVSTDGSPGTKTITRTLFNVGNPYPQKKVLTFNRYNEDFTFSVSYGKMDHLSVEHQSCIGPFNLTTISLKGLLEALDNNKGAEPGGVKAHFRMDENGLLQLESVQSLFEHEVKEEPSTFSKITNAFSNLFGGSEDGTAEESSKDSNTEKDNATDTPSEKGDTPSEKGDTPSEKEDMPAAEDDTPTAKKDDIKNDTPPEDELKEENTDTLDVDKESKTDDDNVHPDGDDPSLPDDNEEIEEDEEEDSNGEEEEVLDDEENDTTNDDKDAASNDSVNTEDSSSNSDSVHPTTTTVEGTTPSSTDDDEPKATPETKGNNSNQTVSTKKAKETGPKTRTVKVNITAEVSLLDLKNLTDKEMEASITKLNWLHQRDEDRRLNELAKNNLESHIFEFTEYMYTEIASMHSTETEKTEIMDSLEKASEWLEEEGFKEETTVYKQKLRELKRVSRPLVRRIDEATQRPKLFAELNDRINTSIQFLLKAQNFSENEIFTEVEIKTLLDITNESKVWLVEAEEKQKEVKPYEDPVVLCSEIEDKIRKLEREIMYLVNKIKNYVPKRPKTSNATNSTTPPTTPNNNTNNTKNNTTTTNNNNNSSDTIKPNEEEKSTEFEEFVKEENKEKPAKKSDRKKTDKKEETEKEEEEILQLPSPDDTTTDTSQPTTEKPTKGHAEL